MCENVKVTIWNEFRHEQKNEQIAKVYPNGMHGAIAEYLQGQPGIAKVHCATLDEPEHGLSDAVLADTDVLTWWGHVAHGDVQDQIVDRVYARVLDGMGLVVLHSGHFSKIFRKLMGSTCNLKWREANEKERLWVVSPGHPIVEGLGEYIELAQEEMYGEHFDIPAPDELVLVSWFEGGEIFRSGCCYRRGRGRIFYFRPGHESYPTYFNAEVRRVIYNACLWAAPVPSAAPVYGNAKPLEKIGE